MFNGVFTTKLYAANAFAFRLSFRDWPTRVFGAVIL